jgi:hypothetical protein
MPVCRKRRRAACVWQRRASALRCWVHAILRAAFRSRIVRVLRLRPHDRTKALNAIRTGPAGVKQHR